MKFSSALKFNAVSDWWDEYIAYDALKKYIYQLEKQQHGHETLSHASHSHRDLEVGEHAALLEGHDATDTDVLFIPLLDRELKKITLFHESQEKELLEELAELEEDVQKQEDIGIDGADRYMDPSDDDDDDESVSISHSPVGTRRQRPSGSTTGGRRRTISGPFERRRSSVSSGEDPRNLEDSTMSFPRSMGVLSNRFSNLRDSWNSTAFDDNTIWTARNDYAYDTRLLFKRRITTTYISFTNLRSYIDINYSGFRKIIKKYDKVTFSELKDRYLHDVVEASSPFTQTTKSKLNDCINRLVELYARCVTHNDKAIAKQQLRLHQRESIAWERDTVWRQMIGRERRGEGSRMDLTGATLVKEPQEPLVNIPTPVGRFQITSKLIWGSIAIVVFAVLLNVNTFKGEAANNCFAILMFCTILWASEAIPLFVTSLSVPLLLIALRVIRDGDGVRMPTADATKYVFSIMFNPTIMLLIGGFTISSALSKTNIDRVIITRVLSFAGTKPRTVLLAFMCVSCFATLLQQRGGTDALLHFDPSAYSTPCHVDIGSAYPVAGPFLADLANTSAKIDLWAMSNSLAANIGGQSSPISSPQNLIAIGEMYPVIGWGSWFGVALPVSFISIILIWGLLLLSYHPERSPDGEGEIEIRGIRPTREKLTIKQCIEKWVGDMGVIALIPLLAFFSTGVLKKDDFERFAWTIVFLAMGGIALGKGVVSSGLLEVLDTLIRKLVDGYSLYTVVLILSPIVLVISTFISHTIASVLLVPIAKEVGKNLPGQPQNLLIFVTALICSTGMGMPVSGFPNQTAATQEDELGELYLSNVDFLKNGVPASIIATAVVSTVGFMLMKLIGV
ncbi:hypothetical protein D9756_002903 [Leucocoprinus leucothites]|uniref:SPX domain-containing protein n=1 Tax=Leucocoprinus leucothites TaxID=201217 RepID=A0A8H5LJ65_9AGAR|nr:hypothetical protein D9756_002903 [Leucoagaricus leucothites]